MKIFSFSGLLARRSTAATSLPPRRHHCSPIRLLSISAAASATAIAIALRRPAIVVPSPPPRSALLSSVPAVQRLGQLLGHYRPASTLSSSAISPSSNNMSSSPDYSQFKLPPTVIPSHYDLLIHSDLKALRFSGIVTATIKVVDPNGVDELVFNAGPKMTFGKAQVVCEQLKTESTQHIEKVSADTKKERASVKLATRLPQGAEAKLTVAFESELDNSMTGYYYSQSIHKGKKILSTLTQFEPTSSRRAFPGWDEPELKATVSFQLIHRKENTALANMPVTKESDVTHSDIDKLLRVAEFGVQAPYQTTASAPKTQGKTEIASTTDDASDNWVVTSFDITPKLSTYLIAWAEGPFKKLESSIKSAKSGRTIQTTAYATEDFIEQSQYTLDVTDKVLPIYEDVFDIEYPLPKMTTLTAADFDAGAMENWGLITGRTSVYACHPTKASLADRKRTASVQSHELAHQWFGNLVTMKWWDNLWLNESFATLMGEMIILDRYAPEWEVRAEFISDHLERALSLDAKRSSHPIEVPLSTESGDLESAINQIFDAISYSKGASTLRMLSTLVGEDTFLKGVSIYLKKHAYSNSVTNDLWNGIAEASGLDIQRIMKNWILKQGFPVITVEEGQDSITVRQNRFLSTGDVKPDEDETLWYVPLAIKTVDANGASKVDQHAVLDEERSAEISLKDAKNATYKLNAETMGVYRVAYSPERLAKLGKEAANKSGAFTLEDRIGLISDAFNLAKAGFGKTSGGLDLLKGFRLSEDRYLANLGASTQLGALTTVWWEQPEAVRDGLDAFRAELFAPAVKKLGFEFPESDSAELRQLRATVIGAAASAKDPATIEEIKKRAKALFENGDDSAIPADLVSTVIIQAVKNGGEEEYEGALRVYRNPSTPSHKNAALMALGYTQDEKLLQRTMDWAFTSEEVKNQDFMYPVMALSTNIKSRRSLLGRMQKDHDSLVKRFEGTFSLARCIESSIRNFSTQKDLEMIEEFFKGRDNSKYQSGLSQGLDAVRGNTAWLDRDAKDVETWLKGNGYLK